MLETSFICLWAMLGGLTVLATGCASKPRSESPVGAVAPPTLAPPSTYKAQPASPANTLAPGQALRLNDAVRLALEHNPELQAASGKVQAAAGRAYQSKLWSNPQLELTAEDWPVNRGGFSDAKQLVGVSQTVPFPGKKNLDRQVGAAGVRLSEAERQLRELELVRGVKAAFFQVLAAERLVGISKELAAVTESSATTARKRVEAGAAPDQELLRAQILLEQARTELASFQRELHTTRQALVTVMGLPDLKDIAVSGELTEQADLTLLNHEPEQWLARHPSMAAARTSRDRAELELRRARLEPYPDVNLGVAGGRDSGPERGSIVQVGVSVPVPIIDRAKGRKQEARANLEVALAEQKSIEQRLRRDWETASQRLRTASEQVANYRERILPKANEALRLVQTGFEQGKFNFIDLVDTQRTAAEARLAYQQKLLELNIAQAELEALLQPQIRQPTTNLLTK